MTRLSPERGAATVELAVAMLLIIPTLLYSLYVGEAYVAGMQAQQVELDATWDLSARRLHDFIGGDEGPLYPAAYAKARAALAEEGQHPAVRGVVLSRSVEALQCERRDVPDTLLTFDTFGAFSDPGNKYVSARQYLHRGGYVGCSARVRVGTHAMPNRFLESFHEDRGQRALLTGNLTSFSLCGNGRGPSGCVGSGQGPGIVLLTDDWAVEDGRTSKVAADVGDGVNDRMYLVGRAVYNADGVDKYWGGIGARKVANTLEFFTDETDRDYGLTSRFKMGSQSPLHDGELQHTDQGVKAVHPTPFHDDQDPGFRETSDVYSERTDGYLGRGGGFVGP